MNVPEKLGVTNINCFHSAWMGNWEMLQEVCLWAQKLIWTTISTKIGRKKWDWQRALLEAGEGRLRMEPEESAEAPWLIPAPSKWWPLCPWAMGLRMRGPQMWAYLPSWRGRLALELFAIMGCLFSSKWNPPPLKTGPPSCPQQPGPLLPALYPCLPSLPNTPKQR